MASTYDQRVEQFQDYLLDNDVSAEGMRSERGIGKVRLFREYRTEAGLKQVAGKFATQFCEDRDLDYDIEFVSSDIIHVVITETH